MCSDLSRPVACNSMNTQIRQTDILQAYNHIKVYNMNNVSVIECPYPAGSVFLNTDFLTRAIINYGILETSCNFKV